jgi:hypothetical protein
MLETGAATPNVGRSLLLVTTAVTPRTLVDGTSDPCPIITPVLISPSVIDTPPVESYIHVSAPHFSNRV